MQLFKDKQLREEFEAFKKDMLSKISTLEDENVTLKKENANLNQANKELNKEITNLYKGFEVLTETVTAQFTVEQETETEQVAPVALDTVEHKNIIFGGKRIPKSLQRIYKSFDFDGFWFRVTSGGDTGKKFINIHQVMVLSKIDSVKSWEKLAQETGFTSSLIQRICFNIINGAFKPYISQYYSTKFTFKNGELLINGCNTGLTKSETAVIVDTYVNNKSENCIKKLCKSYPSISPDYVVCICDNYFRVPVKHQSNVIEFENNPQKRKEKGMS